MRTIKLVLPSGRIVTLRTPIQKDLENYKQIGLINLVSDFKSIKFSQFNFSKN